MSSFGDDDDDDTDGGYGTLHVNGVYHWQEKVNRYAIVGGTGTSAATGGAWQCALFSASYAAAITHTACVGDDCGVVQASTTMRPV